MNLLNSFRLLLLDHIFWLLDSTLRSVITFDRGASWNELFLSEEQCRGVTIKVFMLTFGNTCVLLYLSLVRISQEML